jgi:hypothetical protein
MPEAVRKYPSAPGSCLVGVDNIHLCLVCYLAMGHEQNEHQEEWED